MLFDLRMWRAHRAVCRFGYVDDWEAGGARDPAHYLRNARALGNGLLVSAAPRPGRS